jgi:hypothetical protein
MQLIQINPVQTQATQASFAGGSQVFRPSVFNPSVGTRSLETTLRRDYQVRRIGVQSLGYDLFTHPGTVGIRGIYEIDAQFDGPPQDPDGLGPVSGLAPNSISGNPHCAESQARDTEIVPDQAFAGFSGGSPPWPSCGFVVLHIHHLFLIDAADWRCELLLSGGSALPAMELQETVPAGHFLRPRGWNAAYCRASARCSISCVHFLRARERAYAVAVN